MCQKKDIEAAVVKTPKSPWRRFLRQPMRPKLCRSITSGAKINLNRYWNKFEEVTSLNRAPQALFFTALDDNAINENISNEKAEFSKL